MNAFESRLNLCCFIFQDKTALVKRPFIVDVNNNKMKIASQFRSQNTQVWWFSL